MNEIPEEFTGYEDAFSFRRPAHIVANGMLRGMMRAGLTERQALDLFYSKAYRWALDGSMGEALDFLAYHHGQELARDCNNSQFFDAAEVRS